MPNAWIPAQLVSRSKAAPTGREWLHEIKFDGYRFGARRTAAGVGMMLVSAMEAALKANRGAPDLSVSVTANHSLRLDLSATPLLSALDIRMIRLRYQDIRR